MDFDEILESHFIKKVSNEDGQEKRKEIGRDRSLKIHHYVPCTLKHLLALNERNCKENNVFTILGGRICFKNCLVYGTIITKTREKDNKYSYILDDGTESIEITIFRKDKNLNHVAKLQRNTNDIMESSEDETSRKLKNILSATKNVLFDYSISSGTKVLVYGRPSFYCGKISLEIFNIIQDNRHDHLMEIAFKDEVIDWHKKHTISKLN